MLLVHASTVAIEGKGLLITGASGRGKSGLALQLMAYGARLISDDQTHLSRVGTDIIASAPETIAGMIEMRGVGLLNASTAPPTPLRYVIDMDHTETERLPPVRFKTLLDVNLPLINRSDHAAWPAGLMQLVKEGRQEQK